MILLSCKKQDTSKQDAISYNADDNQVTYYHIDLTFN